MTRAERIERIMVEMLRPVSGLPWQVDAWVVERAFLAAQYLVDYVDKATQAPRPDPKGDE